MRLGPRWLFLPLLFAIVFFTSLSFPLPAVGAESGQEAASALPTLTTAAAVHGLTHAQAKLGYPVHLRAICVVCFADWHGFWVNDGVSGVYVETKDKAPLTAAIHPGAVLDIEGVTGPGEFKPIVNQATMRIVGEAPLPPARDAKLDDFAAGAYDGQWFALEGTVRGSQGGV
jgi:hypothetical protein